VLFRGPAAVSTDADKHRSTDETQLNSDKVHLLTTIMRPFLVGGSIKCCAPSVRLSVPCVRFTRNWRTVQTPSLAELRLRARESKFEVKGQRSRSLGTKT